MRSFSLALVFAMLAGPALAQYTPYQAPSTTSTYDRTTGNRYRTTTQPDGSASVRGSNLETGSRWKTEIAPNGQQRGTDADGNRWTYNPETKTYRNSGTGLTCRGEGARRTCY